MTNNPELMLKELREPFNAADVEWRIQNSGFKNDKPWAMVLAYITARAIQERLDDVCGIFGWSNEYKQGPDGGVVCGISILTPDNGWVTKWDGAENTNIEAVKGGISGSFKRAGAVWGIGRYLYSLDSNFAIITDSGKYSAKIKENNKWFKWNPPKLPVWALPTNVVQDNVEPQTEDIAPEEEPPITCTKLLEKMREAKAFTHLDYIWKKYTPDMAKMTEGEQALCAKTKNEMKVQFNEARDEAVAEVQTDLDGMGDEPPPEDPA